MLFTRVDFWIYVAMALLTASGIILCLLPVMRVNKALTRAAGRLGARKKDGSLFYKDPDFLQCPDLDGHWTRFLNNQELMRKNNAACEVSDFINARTAISEPGHSAFGEILPGLLTTLGILGSFYGIVRGLSSLDMSTTVTMSQSIIVLISGMKVAFNTSIVGAILAVIFQIVRRLVVGKAERSLGNFVRNCQTQIMSMLTPDATLTQTLNAILAELKLMNMNRGR